MHEAAEVEDEGHDHVEDHGRPDGEEGGVDEEEADVRRADAEFFAPPVAHAEGLLFEAGFDVIEEMIHIDFAPDPSADSGWHPERPD